MDPRLLWISDSPGVSTGPGRLSEELLPRLAEDYEIGVLGWPFLQPTTARSYTIFESDSEPWSVDCIVATREQFQPDLVVTLGEVDAWSPLAELPLDHYAAWVGAWGVSAGPIPSGWKEPLAHLDEGIIFGFSAQAWLADKFPHLSTTVILGGVDPNHFHPLSNRSKLRAAAGLEEAFVIGCVARNEPRQHLPRLLEAVARLGEERDDVFLYLHTDPDDVGGDLIAQIEQYGLSDRAGFSFGVTPWTGVSLAELNEIYNLFDVLVLPGAGQRYGLTLQEGLAAGVPVLTGAWGLAEDILPQGYPRLRIQTVLTVPETGQREPLIDVDHLAAELRNLAENLGRREELIHQGLAHASTFTWERASQDWLKVLARARDRSPRIRLFPVGSPSPPSPGPPRAHWLNRVQPGPAAPKQEESGKPPSSPPENPRFSLLLWAEGTSKEILKCLETVWEQEFDNLEVWVLDPGRSLKRIHALRPYLAPWPLHYLPVLERGPVASFNAALKRASGDLLGLWSADQQFYPRAFRWILEAFQSGLGSPDQEGAPFRSPHIDLVVGETEFHGAQGGLARPATLTSSSGGSEHHLFFRRCVWEKLGDLRCLHPAAALVDYQNRALQAGFRLASLEFILGRRWIPRGTTRSQAETREFHLAHVQAQAGKDQESPSPTGNWLDPNRSPLVSVVMPTYNQAELLPEALASLQAQTFPHWELMVVNDGSTDDTKTVLSQFKEPRMTVVSLPQNQGIPRALNEGFCRVRGDYVTFISSDNQLHPQLLGRLVEALEEHPQAGVAYADYEEIGNRPQVVSLAGVTPETIAEKGWSLGPAFLIRTQVLDEFGWPPYDETLAGIEDTTLWLDLSLFTFFHHVPAVLCTYRRHPGQMTAQLERAKAYEPLRAALRQRKAQYQLGAVRRRPRRATAGRRRILFLYRHACHGGVEVALWHLLPALAAWGFDAEVCFLTDQGGVALFEGICPVHVLGTDDSRKAKPRLRRIISDGDFDLLHQIAVPWLTKALPGTGFKGPVVAGCHGNLELLEGVTAQNTDALLVVSEALRESAQSVVPDLEPRVIPNGLDLNRFAASPAEVEDFRRRQRLPTDRRILAWVGRLSQEKNWPFFLHLLSRLRSRRDDVVGVLIGGGEAEEAIHQEFAAQVEMAGLAPFLWRPTLSPREMPAFYRLVASTRGLLLSTSHEEAFGLTLLEAMASGVPVMAPAIGGIPEVVRDGDTGTLLNPEDSVVTWIEAIESLLEDGDRYQLRAERGRKWVAERFAVQAVGARHAALYESLLEARKSPCVVILSGTVWTESGGGQRPRKWAETLARQGHRVLFVQQFGPGAAPWGYVEIQVTQAVTGARWRARSFSREEQQAIAEEMQELLRSYRPRLVINCVFTELARLQMAACQRLGARAIYDCMDDWGAFSQMQREAYGEDSGYEEKIEKQLCQQADRVAVTVPALARRLTALGSPPSKQVLVPNGLDSAFLRRRRGARPSDLPDGEQIMGYTGCLWGEWQDWPLVRSLAQARPHWVFILLGPYAGQWDDLFAETPNVFFLGPRPHSRLHEYIDYFDVGLIPFKAGAFAQTISPLKVFDYLARGKPVVSPPMEGLQDYPYLWTAQTPAEWLTALEEALSTPPDRAALADFLANHTWEQRLSTLLGPWLEDFSE